MVCIVHVLDGKFSVSHTLVCKIAIPDNLAVGAAIELSGYPHLMVKLSLQVSIIEEIVIRVVFLVSNVCCSRYSGIGIRYSFSANKSNLGSLVA